MSFSVKHIDSPFQVGKRLSTGSYMPEGHVAWEEESASNDHVLKSSCSSFALWGIRQNF